MKYTEVDVLNYVDGNLNDIQTAEFLAALRSDPELARTVTAMQESELPISQAYQQNPLPPTPDALRARVEKLVLDANADQANRSVSGSSTLAGLKTGLGFAACLFLGVGIGALLSQVYRQTNNTNPSLTDASSTMQAPHSAHERLVKRVADYQSLYVEKTVASLSTTRVEDAQALLESISQRTGTPLSIMDYSSFGYEFARAQELGFEDQTLVQLVYRKKGTAPLAICFMPGENTPSKPLAMSQQNQLNTASWISNNNHHVLVADEDNTTLQQLYEHTVVNN